MQTHLKFKIHTVRCCVHTHIKMWRQHTKIMWGNIKNTVSQVLPFQMTLMYVLQVTVPRRNSKHLPTKLPEIHQLQSKWVLSCFYLK